MNFQVDDSAIEERINSDQNAINILHKPFAGRKTGDVNIPEFLRPLIGLAAQVGSESQKEIAKNFNISQAAVSLAANAKRSVQDNPDPSFQEQIDKQKVQINKMAIDRLKESLGFIDNDKLSSESAGNLSRIASNLATVVEKTSPGMAVNPSIGQVIIYAPAQREIDTYRTIEVEPRLIE